MLSRWLATLPDDTSPMRYEAHDRLLHADLLGWARELNAANQLGHALRAAEAANKLVQTREGLVELAYLACQLTRDHLVVQAVQGLVARFGLVDAAPLMWLGLAQARLGQFEEAARSFDQYALYGMPDAGLARYYRAGCLAMSGHVAAAHTMLRAGISIPLADGRSTHTAVLDFNIHTTAAAEAAPGNHQIVFGNKPRVDDHARCVLFIGCDQNYFSLFARAAARSAAQHAGCGFVMHFHVVNPDASLPDTIDAMALLLGIPIGFSHETTDLSGLDDGQVKTYYSCARFIALPHILDAYGLLVVMADADQLIVKSIVPLLEQFDGHEFAAISFDAARWNLLSWISASVILCSASAAGRHYATKLSEFLATSLRDPSRYVWHLDQAALAVTRLLNPSARVLDIAPSIMQSHVHAGDGDEIVSADTVFWSVTYSIAANRAKLNHALFQAMDQT